MTLILKALVGSRAHGLHTENSDYDYRGVYVQPTADILRFDAPKSSGTQWMEGESEDNTAYEIGHFLMLCTKANPSVLEVLLASVTPVNTPWADEMRMLLPYMYDPNDAYNAFAGYSKNQQKKLLENHLGRREKFGVAYIRTAYNLVDLLAHGTFDLEVKDLGLKRTLIKCRLGELTNGEIIDIADDYLAAAIDILPRAKNHKDLGKINDFLLKVRREFW